MGLLGGAHCAGMCAPFALAVSAGAAGRGTLMIARHIAYQLGKATAYVFLGVVLFVALGWTDAATPLAKIQDWVAWIAGATMIVIGAGHAFGWRWAAAAAGQGGCGWAGRACGALRALWNAPSLWRCALIGWVNGFLPCGLSLAALLYLASRDSLEGLVAGCYVFGLGTTPALLALGWLGARFSPRAAGRALRVAGVALALFGVLTIFRGSPAVHGWFHEHTVPGGDGAHGEHGGHSH